jgi:hypothetical protein
MNAHEWDRVWDNIIDWFEESRLRCLALLFALSVVVVALFSYVGDTLTTDYETQLCLEDEEGMRVPGGVCTGEWSEMDPYADWDITRYYGWGIVAMAAFLIPMLNAALLGLRASTKGARSRLAEAFSNRGELRDERARRRRAEELSDRADAETARVQRELDQMMTES